MPFFVFYSWYSPKFVRQPRRLPVCPLHCVFVLRLLRRISCLDEWRSTMKIELFVSINIRANLLPFSGDESFLLFLPAVYRKAWYTNLHLLLLLRCDYLLPVSKSFMRNKALVQWTNTLFSQYACLGNYYDISKKKPQMSVSMSLSVAMNSKYKEEHREGKIQA